MTDSIKIIPLLIVLAIAFVSFIIHIKFPENKITNYLIPEILPDKKHSKSKLRKTGIAYIFFGIWLILIILGIMVIFDINEMDKHPLAIGTMFFVIPIFIMLSWVIGFYYLFLGIFSKKDSIRPKLEASDFVDENELEKYILKLELYTFLNILCIAVFLIMILLVNLFDVFIIGETFAIIFILILFTGTRLNIYINKSVTVLISKGENLYNSIVLFPIINLFLAWIYSIKIIQLYNQNRRNL